MANASIFADIINQADNGLARHLPDTYYNPQLHFINNEVAVAQSDQIQNAEYHRNDHGYSILEMINTLIRDATRAIQRPVDN
jgi:hypothetical protein